MGNYAWASVAGRSPRWSGPLRSPVTAAPFAACVDLVVLDQAIDTAAPVGQLVFHVLGAIAEFDRTLIRERVRAGLAAAKRRGQRLGRPPVVSPDARARIRRLRASGHSLRAIAATVGVSLGS